MTFENLNLIEPILKALQKEGYSTPTPIQEKSIPILLQGKDLLGCAQTGTGKTAAFSIPILQKLYKTDNRKSIKALILTPTRELAIQIGECFSAYGKYTGLRHAVIFGGVGQKPQTDELKRGVQILVATPGRLQDLVNQGFINLKALEFFVLDEADRMLDMGFIHDIRRILKLLPAKRQTLFFSATMPPEIETLANSMLTHPEKVEVTPASSTVDTISQSVYFVEKKEKKDGFFKRIFGNIITEQSAEEEAKEREKEQADAEEKKAAKEEKKQQTAEEKAAKAEQAKEEKEKKAAAKAEQAAAKAAEKEEKKRLKAEQEANEVVGRINPVGAAIVMVFFGLLCVAVVFGSQALSYTTSVKSAESSFEQRDYKNAYDSLAGVSVSDSSKELKQKVRMCMQLQREYDAYQNYYKMKMYLESLDSLIGGIRLYDANKAKAEQYDMLSQYNELESKLANQLYNEFGVSESQARNIIASETQKEYTDRLQAILLQWQKRNEADER